MKKITIFAIFISIISLSAFAQNDIDALRYSKTTFGGTARYMGLCGAFGALGADFSVLSTNPAGIGLYKSSEFTITPTLYYGATNSSYNGTSREDSKYNFNLNNVGIILTSDISNTSEQSVWKNVQFGFGINRINNFNNRILIEGQNSQNSILNSYVEYADGNYYNTLNQYDTQLAFDTWLLDTITGNDQYYYSAVPYGGVLQQKLVETSGSMNEVVLSVGANYDDILYLGATFGFPSIRYTSESTYTETDVADTIPRFDQLTIRENVDTKGTGFNFKFGMIFRPLDFVRIGAAIHTPTFYGNMKDNWNTSIESTFSNTDHPYNQADSPNGYFDYELTTPMKILGSIAFIIGQNGLVSADYEFIDYSTAKLKSSSYSFFDENDNIRTKYTSAGNLRLGTEWRYDIFNFRGGYAIYGNPFKSGLNDAKSTSFSLGFGIRERNYFIDFAYVNTKFDEDYYLYGTNNISVNPVENKFKNNQFLITVGIKY